MNIIIDPVCREIGEWAKNFVDKSITDLVDSVRYDAFSALDQFLFRGCGRNPNHSFNISIPFPRTLNECKSRAPQDIGHLKIAALATRYFCCKGIHPLLNKSLDQFDTTMHTLKSSRAYESVFLDNLPKHLKEIIKIYEKRSEGYYNHLPEERREPLIEDLRVLMTGIPIASSSKEEIALKIFRSINNHLIPGISFTLSIPKTLKPVEISASSLFKTVVLCSLLYLQFYVVVGVFLFAKLLPKNIINQFIYMPIIRCMLQLIPVDMLSDIMGQCIYQSLQVSLNRNQQKVFSYLAPSPTAGQITRRVNNLRSERSGRAIATNVVRFASIIARLDPEGTASQIPKALSLVWKKAPPVPRVEPEVPVALPPPEIEQSLKDQLKLQIRNYMAVEWARPYVEELEKDRQVKKTYKVNKESVETALKSTLKQCKINLKSLEQGDFNIGLLFDIQWPEYLEEQSGELLRLKNLDLEIRQKIIREASNHDDLMQYALFFKAFNCFPGDGTEENLANLKIAYAKIKELALPSSPPSLFSFLWPNTLSNDNEFIRNLGNVLETEKLTQFVQISLMSKETTFFAFQEKYRLQLIQHFQKIQAIVQPVLDNHLLRFTPFLERVESVSLGIDGPVVDKVLSLFTRSVVGSVGDNPASQIEIKPGTPGHRINQETKSRLERLDVFIDLLFEDTPRELLIETLAKIAGEQWLTAFPVR